MIEGRLLGLIGGRLLTHKRQKKIEKKHLFTHLLFKRVARDKRENLRHCEAYKAIKSRHGQKGQRGKTVKMK